MTSSPHNQCQTNLLAALDGKDTPSKRWIRAHLDYPHSDRCLIWPFGRTPGKFASIGKLRARVHRLMCEYRNGPAPSDKPQAAHSCGQGHNGCVNPLHLSWKNNSENQFERFVHSGPTKRAKLTPVQVAEIRALKGTATPMAIAARYGVSEVNIRGILSGKLWNNTSTLTRVTLTEDQVLLIRATSWRVKNARQFATEFGVSLRIIQNAREGITYKWVKPSQKTERAA